MTQKDFYVLLKEIHNQKPFDFGKLFNKNDLSQEEIEKIISRAYILIELKNKKYINDIEIKFTVRGLPFINHYPYLTIDGYEFMKNYKGTFKNRCIFIVKNIWLIIVFFFSLTGSFWALINILSYYGFISKP